MKTSTYDEVLWRLVPKEPTGEMAFATTHINNTLERGEVLDMLRAAIAAAPAAPETKQEGLTDDAAFEKWWQEHGQYCRAGGGDYEKTFAYRAWQVRALLASQPAPAVPPEVTNAIAAYNKDSTNAKAHAFVCIVEDWLELIAAAPGAVVGQDGEAVGEVCVFDAPGFDVEWTHGIPPHGTKLYTRPQVTPVQAADCRKFCQLEAEQSVGLTPELKNQLRYAMNGAVDEGWVSAEEARIILASRAIGAEDDAKRYRFLRRFDIDWCVVAPHGSDAFVLSEVGLDEAIDAAIIAASGVTK